MLSWKPNRQNPMDAMGIARDNSRPSIILLPMIAVIIIIKTSAAANAAFSHYGPSIMSDSSSDQPQPSVCGLVNCLQGTCKSSSSLLGFDCECYPGWKKFLGLPFCVIPDCSFHSQCGNQSLPSPPPAAPVFLPLPFTPCFLVWCGDGECVANGTDHSCECNSGSANLLNMTGLPCIRQCNLGIDCKDVQIGPPNVPPPPPPPPATSSATSGNGLVAQAPNGSRTYQSLSTLLVAALILIWI